MATRAVPDGYHTLTPYLLASNVTELIQFLQTAFGAREYGRIPRPDGTVMHAELRIGDSPIMLGEPMGEFEATRAHVFLYSEDSDALYQRALDAGAQSVMEPTTMQHAGERYGGVRDPAGNTWWISTQVEDVSWEEQCRRVQAMTKPHHEL